jgi:hypothetical protein
LVFACEKYKTNAALYPDKYTYFPDTPDAVRTPPKDGIFDEADKDPRLTPDLLQQYQKSYDEYKTYLKQQEEALKNGTPMPAKPVNQFPYPFIADRSLPQTRSTSNTSNNDYSSKLPYGGDNSSQRSDDDSLSNLMNGESETSNVEPKPVAQSRTLDNERKLTREDLRNRYKLDK